jgi:hypothetical protein
MPSGRTENKTQPVDDAIMQPLLAAALFLTSTPAPGRPRPSPPRRRRDRRRRHHHARGARVKVSAAQRTENENRIRAAMDRLLRGEIPPGGKCDVKTLATTAEVDRTAFYGTRPYTHLRIEFERRLQALQDVGEIPDPREAQIARLEAANTKLKERLARSEQTIDELTDFRSQALSRLAAQHEEIVHLRESAAETSRATRLPTPPTTVIGSCS